MFEKPFNKEKAEKEIATETVEALRENNKALHEARDIFKEAIEQSKKDSE